MKKLLCLLLILPTLCFAKIGDTKKELIARLNTPKIEKKIGTRVEFLEFSNGEICVWSAFLDGHSVIESYFSYFGDPVSSEKLERLLGSYGNKWFPVPDKGNSKTVINEDNTVMVSYGDLVLSDYVLHNVITVISPKDATVALEELRRGVSNSLISL